MKLLLDFFLSRITTEENENERTNQDGVEEEEEEGVKKREREMTLWKERMDEWIEEGKKKGS